MLNPNKKKNRACDSDLKDMTSLAEIVRCAKPSQVKTLAMKESQCQRNYEERLFFVLLNLLIHLPCRLYQDFSLRMSQHQDSQYYSCHLWRRHAKTPHIRYNHNLDSLMIPLKDGQTLRREFENSTVPQCQGNRSNLSSSVDTVRATVCARYFKSWLVFILIISTDNVGKDKYNAVDWKRWALVRSMPMVLMRNSYWRRTNGDDEITWGRKFPSSIVSFIITCINCSRSRSHCNRNSTSTPYQERVGERAGFWYPFPW